MTDSPSSHGTPDATDLPSENPGESAADAAARRKAEKLARKAERRAAWEAKQAAEAAAAGGAPVAPAAAIAVPAAVPAAKPAVPAAPAPAAPAPAAKPAALDDAGPRFADLGLSADVLRGLDAVGYESPSPIQAEAIPVLLAGHDLVGQAQTGTGKTAAFALPLLSRLDLSQRDPQILVLTPTRELAIQVAEAFQKYAHFLPGFHVLPVYGGAAFGPQLKQLQRGAHVVVGTPGRVMDHIRRNTLRLDGLQSLVLDEADEMLRMGFIDDVEWILTQTPPTRQIALFSATMPPQIRRIAESYLEEPVTVTIKVRTTTAATINQRYWMVSGLHKLNALTRILEAEPYDGVIVFVRTKHACEELAEKLEARGFASAPLNGDIAQAMRERTIDALRAGKLDILVATDVAARGLDVERISHVINYDVPYDTETYIHRVGRTGRAGRQGEAIIFIQPRERRMLRAIETATNQKIAIMDLPTAADINDTRIARFKSRITDTLATEDLGFYTQIIESYRQEHNIPAIEIASALAKLLQGDEPMLIEDRPERPAPRYDRDDRDDDRSDDRGPREPRQARESEQHLVTYRIEVGHSHGVRPGNIVGAIANEANLDARDIGNIRILGDHSTVDLPAQLSEHAWDRLRKAWVSGQQLNISFLSDRPVRPERKHQTFRKHKPDANAYHKKPHKKGKGKP